MGATDPKTTPMWKKFASGALAGLIGSGLANPADLLKTRMQAAPPGEHLSLRWHISDVYTHGGIAGFYRGVIPTMVRATLLGAAYLGSYDSTKYFIINNGYLTDGAQCQFISTVVAGLCMTIFTSPADNVKTRIMNQRAGSEKKYNGIFDCIGKMWTNEGGVAAFYRGFGP